MIKTFSRKQRRVLSWWHRKSHDFDRDAIICDGSVRSGKTFCMSLSFVIWSFYFGGTSVLIVVGVALEIVQQVNSQLMMRNYEGVLKRAKGGRGLLRF